MRLSTSGLVILGALGVLVAIAVTDQVLPGTQARTAELRPWIAARALGVTAYLLLGVQIAIGLFLSHPRNASAWQKTRQALPWHELLTVFVGAFLALHIVLLAVDPWAKVGWVGALVPGMASLNAVPVAIGTVAMYALIFTAATAKWTRLLPSGWWLKAHRFAAVTFLLSWVHSVLAGTDGGALTPMYLATGLPIVAGVAHRWWTAKVRPQRESPVPGADASPAPRPRPGAVLVEES